MGSITETRSEAYLYKHAHSNDSYLTVEAGSGLYLKLSDGREILDATGGAAVSAIGHGNKRVQKAIVAQLEQVEYCYPGFFKTACAQQLADHLVKSTNGKMVRAAFLGSGMKLLSKGARYIDISNRTVGSEAMEAAMKLARQYFLELSAETPRYRFIAREGSWHGATIGTLAIGDFKARKWPFEALLSDNISRVSACNPYRGMKTGETSTDYISRLAQELEDEFQRVGPDTVCAFIAEPMVGTVRFVPNLISRIVLTTDLRHWAV